jgi:AcrR family transcriptional regulator
MEVHILDGYQKRTLKKMETIEESTIKLLSLPINDIKINEIAKLAKVSQVSIYNYYGSKEALLKAAFVRVMNQQFEIYKQLFTSDLPFSEKLKQLFIQKKQAASLMNIETYTSLIRNDEEFKNIVMDFTTNKSFSLFISLIEEGRTLGSIRNGVTNQTLLMYTQVLSQAFINMDTETSQYLQHPDVIDEFMNLFLYGLLKQDENQE